MILAIDIGNSRTKLARFPGRPSAVGVSSVNPKALRRLLPQLRALGAPVLVAGRDFAIPLENRCRPARAVGTDRLLGAYAAWRMARGPALVIDAGTAVTANLVDARGRFLGGAIASGPEAALAALAKRAARLPRTSPRGSARFPAQGTRAAMRAGAAMALRGFAQEAVAEATRRLGRRPAVFVTGGAAGMLGRFLPGAPFRPRLVLEGIALAIAEARSRTSQPPPWSGSSRGRA